MTIAAAWIRKLRDYDELVFVSDSRLSGDGRMFDGCPKIITLPRSDCVIGFAGYTGDAFPMMLQLALAIDSHAPSRRGSLDVTKLKSHALKVFNGMLEQICPDSHVKPPQPVVPKVNFLFGGYSWQRKEFELWSISYSLQEKQFVAHSAQWLSHCDDAKKVLFRRKQNIENTRPIGRLAFAGDQAEVAMKLLSEKLATKDAQSLDMEPFEVIRDMLRNPAHSETIGGAPQIVKVYQYMETAPIGVFWPDKKTGKIHLQGRLCLGYEGTDRWILDPDTLRSENNYFSSNDVSDGELEEVHESS